MIIINYNRLVIRVINSLLKDMNLCLFKFIFLVARFQIDIEPIIIFPQFRSVFPCEAILYVEMSF